MLPAVRGSLSLGAPGQPERVILHYDDAEDVSGRRWAAERVPELTTRGMGTPEHLLRAGRLPVWLDLDLAAPAEHLSPRCGAGWPPRARSTRHTTAATPRRVNVRSTTGPRWYSRGPVILRRRGCSSRVRRSQRLPPPETRVGRVPEHDALLTETPAEEDVVAFSPSREIYQALTLGLRKTTPSSRTASTSFRSARRASQYSFPRSPPPSAAASWATGRPPSRTTCRDARVPVLEGRRQLGEQFLAPPR